MCALLCVPCFAALHGLWQYRWGLHSRARACALDGRAGGRRARACLCICQPDPKRKCIEAFRSLNFKTIAAGDSYNDRTMLGAADRGIWYECTDAIAKEIPQFPVAYVLPLASAAYSYSSSSSRRLHPAPPPLPPPPLTRRPRGTGPLDQPLNGPGDRHGYEQLKELILDAEQQIDAEAV
eukprot:SAG25_NODE_139_length_14140_cov_7.185101_6_plen_180_part_00